MSLSEWNVWDLENTGIFESCHVFFRCWECSLETCSRQVGCLHMHISLHLCVDLVHAVMCAYVCLRHYTSDFVSEQMCQSCQTEDRSQLITYDLMYLNILKRLFFLNIKSLIQPPPQQPAACAGKTWINWKWVCSSGEISFFSCRSCSQREVQSDGSASCNTPGMDLCQPFPPFNGGIVRQSGGHPQNSTFWSCEGLRDFSKTFVSLCGENSN